MPSQFVATLPIAHTERDNDSGRAGLLAVGVHLQPVLGKGCVEGHALVRGIG